MNIPANLFTIITNASLHPSTLVSGADRDKSSEPVKKNPLKINLWSDQAPISGDKTENTNTIITVYFPENANGTAIIICPGGGYGGLVKEFEGVGIAKWLNQHGITGVVLEYRLPRGDAYRPLFDVQHAIRTVRAKAGEWNLDPKRIGVMGFSAGGHLASTSATHFGSGQPDSADLIKKVSCRPDFAILIYPVITMETKMHSASKINLLGDQPKKEMVELFSNEKQVSDQTPPTFLAHAADDKIVSPENSKLFYDALLAHGVEAKYLQLPSGGHGLNHYQGPMWDAWQTQSLEWLAEREFIK